MKNYTLIILLTLLIQGCSSDLEDSIGKTEDCLEDKFDDGKAKYESIDEAVTAYDFESARVLLGCYEDACFDPYYGDDKRPCYASNKAEQNPYYRNLLKIVSTEVTYLFKIGEYNRAKSTAMEAKMFFVYQAAIPNLINTLIDKNEVDEAVSILSKYTFTNAIDKNNHYNNNTAYNNEANKVNDMINSLFNDALFKQNKSVLKKGLLLYLPIVENDGKWDFKDKRIVNSYKNNAHNKLREARITL